jgi:hypothetical protein
VVKKQTATEPKRKKEETPPTEEGFQLVAFLQGRVYRVFSSQVSLVCSAGRLGL